MAILVTHTSPDFDAITSCWLLERFGGLAADVVFVNTGSPDRAVLDAADAVVDTGREHDPARLRFDHHQFPGAKANNASAAMLVWRHLKKDSPLVHLRPLVNLISAGDTGNRAFGAEWSRDVGIHALLSAKKTRKATDAELLAFGYELLDLIAERLERQQEARATLHQHITYKSTDGLLVALEGAPQGATWAAFEDGARVVLFHSPSETTVAVGMQRAGEWQEPHCGELVLQFCLDFEAGLPIGSQAAYAELATWYRHEAGFVALRGSAKAPDTRPLLVPLVDIAVAIDKVWAR